MRPGGCFSWISLALHLIEKGAGPEVARLTSEVSLKDNDLLRQVLVPVAGPANKGTSLLVRAQEIVQFQNPSINASQLASALCITERTLQRRLRMLSQETPKGFITRLRIEMACPLLASTGMSIPRVAIQCGYSEDKAFRKAFNQIMKMSPVKYRQLMRDKRPPGSSNYR